MVEEIQSDVCGIMYLKGNTNHEESWVNTAKYKLLSLPADYYGYIFYRKQPVI